MARPFIGQNGFYPAWAKGNERWVIQRVLTTVKGMMATTDEMARPAISRESLVWVPRHWLSAFRSFETGVQASRALNELQQISLVCSACDWTGNVPGIEVNPREGPTGWRLRCSDCYMLVGPNLDGLDPSAIIQRWKEQGKPRLDSPAASVLIESVAPLLDLETWIQDDKYPPMENEVAYVGQQLWPNFAQFIADARPG